MENIVSLKSCSLAYDEKTTEREMNHYQPDLKVLVKQPHLATGQSLLETIVAAQATVVTVKGELRVSF